MTSERIGLFLPTLRGGGAEKMIVHIANALVEKGFSVDLVLAKAEGVFLDRVSTKVNVIDPQSDCLIKALLIFCLSVSTGLIFHQIFEFKVLRFDYMNHIWGYISFTTSIITGLALETRQESEITT